MEVVRADKQLFIAATSFVEARYYDQEFDPIKFISRRKDGIPKSVHGLKVLCGNPKGGGQTPKGDYNHALQADEWPNHRGDR